MWKGDTKSHLGPSSCNHNPEPTTSSTEFPPFHEERSSSPPMVLLDQKPRGLRGFLSAMKRLNKWCLPQQHQQQQLRSLSQLSVTSISADGQKQHQSSQEKELVSPSSTLPTVTSVTTFSKDDILRTSPSPRASLLIPQEEASLRLPPKLSQSKTLGASETNKQLETIDSSFELRPRAFTADRPPRMVVRNSTAQSAHRRSTVGSFSFSVDSLRQIMRGDPAQPPMGEVEFDNDSFDDSYSLSDDEEEDETLLVSPEAVSNEARGTEAARKKPERRDSSTSPTSVLEEDQVDEGHCMQRSSNIVTGPPLPWMLDWASAAPPHATPTAAVESPAAAEPTCLDRTSCYFSAQPIPQVDSTTEAILQGWALVSEEGSSHLENTNSGMLWFVRMVAPRSIRLSRPNVPERQFQFEYQVSLRLEAVSDAKGECLSIYDHEDRCVLSILPVYMSPHKIWSRVFDPGHRRHSSSSAPTSHTQDDCCVCDSARYAPAEQHDAVLHWRFALDFTWARG